jgi:hypothetical protein
VSRLPDLAPNAFDRAAAAPLRVVNTYDPSEQISPEPACRYFIRQLIALGAWTLYSCEGHTARNVDFSITFVAAPHVALRVSRAGWFTVILRGLTAHEIGKADYVWHLQHRFANQAEKLNLLRHAAADWEQHFGPATGLALEASE